MKKLVFILCCGLVFSCKSPQARRPVTHKTGTFLKESVKRNKKLIAQEEGRIQQIIRQDSTHHYISSPNGFWYRYDTKVDGSKSPSVGDEVNFNYDIRTLDGRAIYTRKEIGTREYRIDKEDIFTGLRQGLKLMKKGETVTFLFPSYKAFGYSGDNDKIGRNWPIRSTVTLNSIKKVEYKSESLKP